MFHVAGTNGKGSTCAYLRAMLEAEGYTVHAATKPHLVRYNERIRIAGQLIEDAELATLLEEVLDKGADLSPSFFEVTTAATFLAFTRNPADACVIETGLGGRFDATNMISKPAVCGIASLGIDHEAFLLAPEKGVPQEPLARIAFEKAGIAKRGVPLVTMDYPDAASEVIIEVAERVGAPLYPAFRRWFYGVTYGRVQYRDHAALMAPLPSLAGSHQIDNYALAMAMARHQTQVPVSVAAIKAAATAASWPARLQLLGPGPLTALVNGRRVWLDGGHNADAGEAIARHFAGNDPIHLIIGMLAAKNPGAIAGPLRNHLASLTVVPVAGHDSYPPSAFGPAARSAADVATALRQISTPGDVLIAGSLYLAGSVLAANDEVPD